MERVKAFIIDVLVIAVTFYLIDNLIPLKYPISTNEVWGLTFQFGYSLYFVVFFFYFVFFDLVYDGKSIGKKAMQLKVSRTASQMTIKEHVFRSFWKMMSFIFFPITVPLFLFFDWTLQDYFLKTTTVKEEIIHEF